VQINGDDVEDVSDLQKALKSHRDGDGWQVVIERDGQVRQVLVR
jgi:S1-C subfamily serine protease